MSPGPPTVGGTPRGCPVGEVFETLGRAHTLEILHLFLADSRKPLRFVEIQTRLRLSPNTVSDRLKGLVDSGLLTRTVFHELPPRVEYATTPKLCELGSVFEQLQSWANRNDLAPASAPIRDH
jgi:DNA-binding HxlR family transcriptional regulator